MSPLACSPLVPCLSLLVTTDFALLAHRACALSLPECLLIVRSCLCAMQRQATSRETRATGCCAASSPSASRTFCQLQVLPLFDSVDSLRILRLSFWSHINYPEFVLAKSIRVERLSGKFAVSLSCGVSASVAVDAGCRRCRAGNRCCCRAL